MSIYFNMLENVVNCLGDYKIDESLCTRVISPRATCGDCVNACPLSCIKIDEHVLIESHCMNCGLCSSRCKTGAITKKNSTVKYIHYKMQKDEIKHLECKNGKNIKDPNFKSFCMGDLTDESILYILLKNPELISHFDFYGCESCKMGFAVKDFLERKEKIAKKIEESGLTDLTIFQTPKTDEEDPEFDSGKRTMLLSIFKLGKLLVDTENDEQRTLPEYNKMYNELLAQSQKVYGLIERKYPTKAKEGCFGCEACVKLCPTQALMRKGDSIYLNPNRCSGCELCKDVCFDEILEMKEISYEEFQNKQLKIV